MQASFQQSAPAGRVIPFPRHAWPMPDIGPWAAYWVHPEIARLIDRLDALDDTCALSAREDTIITWSKAAIETEAGHHRWELACLSRDRLLPDPGARPSRGRIINHQPDAEGLRLFLGYLHRVREWVEKTEAKYGIGGGDD